MNEFCTYFGVLQVCIVCCRWERECMMYRWSLRWNWFDRWTLSRFCLSEQWCNGQWDRCRYHIAMRRVKYWSEKTGSHVRGAVNCGECPLCAPAFGNCRRSSLFLSVHIHRRCCVTPKNDRTASVLAYANTHDSLSHLYNCRLTQRLQHQPVSVSAKF